jgi:hypothetical protein
MPMPLRVSRALVRSFGPSLLLTVAVFLFSGSLFGQVVTGISVIKTCPGVPIAPGTSFQCTYTAQNQDAVSSVINLAVTNQAPFPGGPITSVACNQGATAVTTLGPNGTATDTCGGSITETAPPCGPTNTFFQDQVAATGTDTGNGLPVAGVATNAVAILACTPTPTPTNTPTGVPPTSTPTNTPVLETPPVPTLSFPMMAMLGLLLAGAGLFLARR